MAVILDAARSYVSHGISVIPVNPLGHERPKRPALEEWKAYQERLPNERELERWWSNGSKLRLAIIGGAVSHGLVIVDIDDLELAERVRSDEDFLDGLLTARTPSGGLHIYLRSDERVRTRPYPQAEKSVGEVRAEGAYVVAPPSQGYAWEQRGRIQRVEFESWFNDFCERFEIGATKKPRRRGLPPVISDNRHILLISEVTRMHYRGYNAREKFAALLKIDTERCKPPLGRYEVRRQVLWSERELPDKTNYELTDLGNAQRFVVEYGQNVRYSPGRGWFIWTGKRWLRDDLGQVYEMAKNVAASIEGEGDGEALLKWSRVSQGSQRLREMLFLAKTDAGIAVADETFDSDPWLLNCANGTLNLRTGQLQEHRREDFITKQCPVAYEDAEGPTFIRFLRQILPNAQTRGFVQRLFGYAITGDVSEHVFPIMYGSGGNGKSTLNNAILAVLGDYAKQAPKGMFTQNKYGEHPTIMSELQGIRLMFSSETEEGERLSESLVKQSTGGEPVITRRMRQDYFSFEPTHHIFLVTNHLPRVRGTDEGIWRRIKQIPFNIRIDEADMDKELPLKLREEYPFILKWLVAGCRQWQEKGLGEPQEVEVATKGYRTEQDTIALFIADSCKVGRDEVVQTSMLYRHYQRWSQSRGERPMTQTMLGRRLNELGYEMGRDRMTKRIWRGITLARPK